MSSKKLQIIGSLVEVDPTLAQEGQAADAKATGDAINSLQAIVGETLEEIENYLPLSGGIITGTLEVEEEIASNYINSTSIAANDIDVSAIVANTIELISGTENNDTVFQMASNAMLSGDAMGNITIVGCDLGEYDTGIAMFSEYGTSASLSISPDEDVFTMNGEIIATKNDVNTRCAELEEYIASEIDSVENSLVNGLASVRSSIPTNYAGSSSAGGAATSANKLNTDAGDSNTPVYFSNGVPVACASLDLNTTGSAAKLTTARKISLTGGITGSGSFDGSGDLSIATTVQTVFSVGTSAPSNTNLLWIDTNSSTGGLKYYNGSSWVHVPVAYT